MGGVGGGFREGKGLTEGNGTGVSDEGAAFELRGRPKAARCAAGDASKVGSRRDAKRRARKRVPARAAK